MGQKPAYLPQRIVEGSLKPDGFELSLKEKVELIPWDKFGLICLGLVEEPALDSPTNFYLQMKNAVKNLFSRGKKEAEARKRQSMYLELFASGASQPYRFESTSINYRCFVEKVEYVSDANFRNFLKTLVDRIPDCALDESVHAFLRNRKQEVRRYASVYEFQAACLERWQKQNQVSPEGDA